MLVHDFACPLPNGLHARPASALESFARNFAADISLTNRRTGVVANMKSVLDLIGLDARFDDPCRAAVTGAGADAAFAELVRYLATEFAHCDAAIPVAETTSAGGLPLPPSLARLAPTFLRGVTAVPGVACGDALILAGGLLPDSLPVTAGTTAEEWERFHRAVDTVHVALEAKSRHAGIEGELAHAHLAILRDPLLNNRVNELVASGASVAAAIITAGRSGADQLRRTTNAVLRERAMDVEDVCLAVLAAAYGPEILGRDTVRLAAPTIVVADNLTPSQLLALDRKFLKGIVLGHAGMTCHTVILARAFGIPTLAGIADATRRVAPGSPVAIDGELALLVTDRTGPVGDYYARVLATEGARRAKLLRGLDRHGVTRDGVSVGVAANIATPDEAASLVAQGADGVGLFRTEMLFLERDTPPTEDEQTAAYAKAAAALAGRPLIVRLLDIGGDKPLAYLKINHEENPFLGVRGVRLLQTFPELARTQLRAILRATPAGDIWVMVPMISHPREMHWVREQLELARADTGITAPVKLGMMVETPSAAFAAESFAGCADFFSVGTNDLSQYFFAADRVNDRVSPLCELRSPQFLGILAHITAAAKRTGKWVGMCGEMAGDPMNLPLLVALGFDELSMGATRVAEIKTRLARIDTSEARTLLAQALAADSSAAVEALMKASTIGQSDEPMLTAALIRDSSATTQDEAIRELADLLYAEGRVASPVAVELALDARERESTTGFGNGVAIPHCKSSAVIKDSVAILRLKNPVDWKASDDQPVRYLIALAMRDVAGGNFHLKVFASLSRKLINDEFRDELLAQPTPEATLAYLDAGVFARLR